MGCNTGQWLSMFMSVKTNFCLTEQAQNLL